MKSKNKKRKTPVNSNLSEALFPKVKRQLLAKLFGSGGKRFYGRELSRMIQGSQGTVRRELQSLVKAGIVATTTEGRHKYYWADPDCMIYQELLNIVTKTFGVVDLIKQALSEVDEKIQIATIFGSVASGKDTARSDIDLLVVGDLTYRQLVLALSQQEESLGRPINPVLYSEDEFCDKYINDSHFVKSVVTAENIFIKGSRDDIERLATEWVGKARTHKQA